MKKTTTVIALALLCALLLPLSAGAAETAQTALMEANAYTAQIQNYTANSEITMTMEAEGLSLSLSAKSENAVFLGESKAHGKMTMEMLGQTMETEQYILPENGQTVVYTYDASLSEEWTSQTNYDFKQALSLFHIPALLEALTADADTFATAGDETINDVACELYSGTLRSDDSNSAFTSIFGELGMGGATEGSAEPVPMPVEIALRKEDRAPVRISIDMSPLLVAGTEQATEEGEAAASGTMHVTIQVQAINETPDFIVPDLTMEADGNAE